MGGEESEVGWDGREGEGKAEGREGKGEEGRGGEVKGRKRKALKVIGEGQIILGFRV